MIMHFKFKEMLNYAWFFVLIWENPRFLLVLEKVSIVMIYNCFVIKIC